jgi:hypothetical protein
LTIGVLTLTPAFDAETLEYATTTTDASNKITATTDDPSAVIVITLENSETDEPVVIENGKPATWGSGENTVTITVTDGASVTEYTVVVTKSTVQA